MESVDLDVCLREEIGKLGVKKLRKSGLIPGIVYKRNVESVPIKFSRRSFIKILHSSAGMNTLINLRIKNDGDSDERTVIIKDMQFNPVLDQVIHVDFNEISLTQVSEFEIPVSVKGEPIGVKRDEGMLEHLLWEIRVECLPTEVPEKITVDVSKMEIGDTIHIKDLILPEGIKVLHEGDAPVLAVMAPKLEKEEAVPEEEIAEPEVIRERKEKEEEESESESDEEKPRKKE